MNKQVFCIIIAAIICAAAFTSCNEATNELKMSSAEEQKNAVITTLSTRSDLSDFVDELKDTDFSDLEAEELTVFAVMNCYLTSETQCDPIIVKRHIVAGKYTRSELSDSLQLTALDGTLLLVTVSTGQIYVNGMKLGNEISVGKSVVHIVEGAIPATPPTPENSNISVTGLTLSQSSVTLEAGETEYIAMLFQPINATNQKVTWQIDSPEVAEVKAINYTDSLFSITAISAGTANVVFTTADGGYTASCVVTVTDNTDPENGEDDDQSGCDHDVIISQKVLMLTVDYTTNTFKGGKELEFSEKTDTFTVSYEYAQPGDFGYIKLFYKEINELLFFGTIHWMGCGKMEFPENLLDANQFQTVTILDYVVPKNGFEDIFPQLNTKFDYGLIWGSVQMLVKAREYLRSNPEQVVKMFLYTPSVGAGNPEDWYWLIFLTQ